MFAWAQGPRRARRCRYVGFRFGGEGRTRGMRGGDGGRMGKELMRRPQHRSFLHGRVVMWRGIGSSPPLVVMMRSYVISFMHSLDDGFVSLFLWSHRAAVLGTVGRRRRQRKWPPFAPLCFGSRYVGPALRPSEREKEKTREGERWLLSLESRRRDRGRRPASRQAQLQRSSGRPISVLETSVRREEEFLFVGRSMGHFLPDPPPVALSAFCSSASC